MRVVTCAIDGELVIADYADVLFGATGSDGAPDAGEVYGLFGRASGFAATIQVNARHLVCFLVAFLRDTGRWCGERLQRC